MWPRLPVPARRCAITQIGQALALLHTHAFPPDILAALAVPRPARTSAEALIGADLNPVPVPRALLLAGHPRGLPHVGAGFADAVVARLHDLARVDPFGHSPASGTAARAGCVHGDAHPANVLWRDGHVTALLDFEWVRLGPADLEIEPYLRGEPREPCRTRAVLGCFPRHVRTTSQGLRD